MYRSLSETRVEDSWLKDPPERMNDEMVSDEDVAGGRSAKGVEVEEFPKKIRRREWASNPPDEV